MDVQLEQGDAVRAKAVDRDAAAPLATARTVLVRKLSQVKQLSAEDFGIIDALIRRRKTYTTGATLRGDGTRLNCALFLLSGWACRQLVVADGRRQIFGFFLPGDMLVPDYESLLMGDIVALTGVQMAVDFWAIKEAQAYPARHALISLATSAALQERKHLLDQQILRLGSMDALQRIAHLLLELSGRLTAVGLCDRNMVALPLTQETLADALGMSSVHVNRTLKQLSSAGALNMLSRNKALIDPVKLAAVVQGDKLLRAKQRSGS